MLDVIRPRIRRSQDSLSGSEANKTEQALWVQRERFVGLGVRRFKGLE